MRRSQIYFIVFLISAIIILLCFQFVFSIYEVEIRMEPPQLYADNTSVCTIRTVPINSFGVKAPLRNAPAEIEIIEGSDLVEIIELDELHGILRIRAKDKTGTVVIFIKPEKSLLPSSIEISIIPNIV